MARWHSAKPASVYACTICFETNRILPGLYPETHQERFGMPTYTTTMPTAVPFVVEKAVEVPVTAQHLPNVGDYPQGAVHAPNAREERIAKAHDENMESAKQMRSMLSCLVSAIVDLTRQLEAMNK